MVDSCGWIAVVDAEINIDLSLLEIIGKYEFIVIDSVWGELERFQETSSKSILLELLRNKSKPLESDFVKKIHTDDNLFYLSKEFGWPVLTVDKKLKKRLFDSNCKVIQVVGGKKIELVS
ncbi:MAG: hypothetical protein CMB48_01215 [Euryarchaeota archaeon]|nr:hypothetical protein [Euryarchaeota archaeon]